VPLLRAIVPRQRAFAADMSVISDCLDELIASAQGSRVEEDAEALQARDYSKVGWGLVEWGGGGWGVGGGGWGLGSLCVLGGGGGGGEAPGVGEGEGGRDVGEVGGGGVEKGREYDAGMGVWVGGC
jgi:hypothetical protein